jgi:hypothetical protein
MQQPRERNGMPRLVVEPRQVIVQRQVGTDDYLAEIRLRTADTRFTEWLVVTPRQELHPEYRPEHWLGDPVGATHGTPEELPGVVALPVDTRRLDAARQHQALAFVVVRLPADDAVIQRVSITVTAARVLPPPAPEPHPMPAPSVVSSSAHIPWVSPIRPAVVPLEQFCGACGRRFVGQEKFCPKDGRRRQTRGE